jgi:hypothetical protein
MVGFQGMFDLHHDIANAFECARLVFGIRHGTIYIALRKWNVCQCFIGLEYITMEKLLFWMT